MAFLPGVPLPALALFLFRLNRGKDKGGRRQQTKKFRLES